MNDCLIHTESAIVEEAQAILQFSSPLLLLRHFLEKLSSCRREPLLIERYLTIWACEGKTLKEFEDYCFGVVMTHLTAKLDEIKKQKQQRRAA